jgi:hypothetical protein
MLPSCEPEEMCFCRVHRSIGCRVHGPAPAHVLVAVTCYFRTRMEDARTIGIVLAFKALSKILHHVYIIISVVPIVQCFVLQLDEICHALPQVALRHMLKVLTSFQLLLHLWYREKLRHPFNVLEGKVFKALN